MSPSYSVVGKSLPKVDGIAKVTGEARFTADLRLPRMLHGKILGSPHPHARILNIDTSRAERLPGVKAVITAKETIKVKAGALTVPPHLRDQLPLADDRVRFVGDEVAAVAAADEECAEEALNLIRVDYEPLPAVFDPLKAMQAGAPRIHDKERNISLEAHYEFGDVKRGFKEAHHIRQDRFETTAMSHGALEPHAVLAGYDPSIGKLIVTTSTQSPQNVAADLALTLGLPMSKVRVNKVHVGGAFGGKIEMFVHDFAAALLSMRTGLPVRIVCSREEVFTLLGGRHPFIIELKTGAKQDGHLTAMQVKIIMDNGAYNRHGPVVLYGAGKMTIPYRIPNFRYDGYLVYTNNTPGTSHQGVGSPQRHFAVESQLDILAEDLGIDPADLRLINAREAGDITPNEYHITSCGLKDSITKAVEHSGWRQKRGSLPKGRGIGLACLGDIAGGVAADPYKKTSGSILQVNPDGRATLFTGAADVGQGSVTILAQIAAEELGIMLEDISIVAGDTELAPPHPGTYWETFLAGNAVKAAAADAKQQLLEVAADLLEANPSDLEARERRIFVAGSPDRSISIAQAAEASFAQRGVPVIGRGSYTLKIGMIDRATGKGDYSASYTFGTRIAEVEVDPDLGNVRVIKMTVAHDCGFAINPTAVEGQIQGGTVMGVGQALTEELIKREGLTLNPSFLDYGLPTVMEAPEVDAILVESIDPLGPYGAKESGQSLQVATAAAIANAVYDAIGVRITSLPITPEKVLRALEEKRKRATA